MVSGLGSPSGKIPDGIFLQSGLAVFAFRGLRTLKQKHRCAFLVLTQHPAVGVAVRRHQIKKPHVCGGLEDWGNGDSVTSRLTDVRRSRPRLAMLAFRAAPVRLALKLA